jgi:hypothetical protein
MTYSPFHDLDTKPLIVVLSHYSSFGPEGYCLPGMTKAGCAAEIASGQSQSVVQVFELFEGKANDITREIGELVWGMPLEKISDSAADFLTICGHDLDDAKRDAEEEAKQAASDQQFDYDAAIGAVPRVYRR